MNGEILFLRRVIEQPASRSYGIEVAQLAGLPTDHAREILGNLSVVNSTTAAWPPSPMHKRVAHCPGPLRACRKPRDRVRTLKSIG